MNEETPKNTVKLKNPAESLPFIANQVSYEGLDEIQRLILAFILGSHVAIDGPPGVGKTHSVIEIASILNRKLYTKSCSSRSSESQIIAFPSLTVQDGASVTRYVNGPLCRALSEGGIFYGDEFNLLKEDVQKRLNSAFDERRSIDRADGRRVQAVAGFWAIISYNPSESLVSRDLEESVADRFIHFHFKRWAPDFKAFISHLRAQKTARNKITAHNNFGIKLKWRGIGKKLEFLKSDDTVGGSQSWVDFLTGKPYPEKPIFSYLVHDETSLLNKDDQKTKDGLNKLALRAFSPLDLSRMLARFTDLLYSLATDGDSPLLKKIGLGNLREKEDLELLSIHKSSARIEIAAMKHYNFLRKKGWNPYLAQSYAVNLVIDQICYGQFRSRRLRDSTVYELTHNLARNLRLLADNADYNTNFINDLLLKKKEDG